MGDVRRTAEPLSTIGSETYDVAVDGFDGDSDAFLVSSFEREEGVRTTKMG